MIVWLYHVKNYNKSSCELDLNLFIEKQQNMDISNDSNLFNSLSDIIPNSDSHNILQYQNNQNSTTIEVNHPFSDDLNSVSSLDRDRSVNIRPINFTPDVDTLSDQFNSLSFQQLDHYVPVFSDLLSERSETNSSLLSTSTSSSSNNTNQVNINDQLPSNSMLNISGSDEYNSLPSLSSNSNPLDPSTGLSTSSYSSLSRLTSTLASDHADLDPLIYALPFDFDKEALANYLNNEFRKVLCYECKKEKYLYNCFYDGKENTYLCVECSVGKNKEELIGLSWEDEENGPAPGFRKCKRLAHYKPHWSFLSRDKQKSKDKKDAPVNENALKIEKQCFYCRNYKRWEYLTKKKSEKSRKKKRELSDCE